MSSVLINYNTDQIHILVSIWIHSNLSMNREQFDGRKLFRHISLSSVDTSNHAYFDYRIVECNEARVRSVLCIQ